MSLVSRQRNKTRDVMTAREQGYSIPSWRLIGTGTTVTLTAMCTASKKLVVVSEWVHEGVQTQQLEGKAVA